MGTCSRVSGVFEIDMLEFPLVACKLNKRENIEHELMITSECLPWEPCSRTMASIDRLEHVTFSERFVEAALYTCVAFTYAFQGHDHISVAIDQS